ncbi:MAG: SDR family NAD(P)-dependent oxidoreductase [Lewinella sp.]
MSSNTLPTAEWVLITGGTHGIGLSLAFESLRQGLGVVAIGLPDEDFSPATDRLRSRSPQNFHSIALDLTANGAVDSVMDYLCQEGITVSYLINNAGFGRGGLFEHTNWAEYRTMMTLNNQVMVELTYRLLPHLRKCGGGILNLSSMEATLPLPYKTVYTGTKAFVYNFSLALREEFRHHGVSVTVLCPGPVLTNADGLRRLEAQGYRAKLLVTTPDAIAPRAIKGMLDGKAVIVPGLLTRILIMTSYLTPRALRMRILEKVFSRYREPAPSSLEPLEVPQ